MSILPDFVLACIQPYLKSLLVWFSDLVYSSLIPRERDHLLIKLRTRLDFAPLDQSCSAFYHTNGPGCKPTFSVPLLVRALLVGYLFDWSLRHLEFQIRFNLVVKWFVGLDVLEAGPDHSTLQRFEAWVCAHQHRTYFDALLHQIDADFPQDRRLPQMGDTYALRANAARESLIQLIRHTCQRTLRALAAASPSLHLPVLDALDHTALFGPADELNPFHLDDAGRQQRLQTTVIHALHCGRLIRQQLAVAPTLSSSSRQTISHWLDLLDKILLDEVLIERDQDAQVVRVTQLDPQHKGNYRIASATDPEATFRVHGDDKIDLGYNISLSVTSHFVREIRADTGAQPDATGIPALITAQIKHHDLCPPKLIYDKAAGSGKCLAAVKRASEGQTQLVAALIDYDQRATRFSPTDFSLSPDGRALTCPEGICSSSAFRSGSGDGWTFRFSASQCAGCSRRNLCRDPHAQANGFRQVFISDYRHLLAAAQAYNQTDLFKADMKLRPSVERIIAAIVRHNGGRHARRRGEEKADFQAKMNATAFNIKTWLRLLDQGSTAAGAADG